MTKRVSNRVSPIFKKLRQIIEFMLPEIDSRGDFVSLGLLVHFIFCYLDEPQKIQLEGIPRQKIRNLKTKVSSLFGNNLSQISGVPPPSGVQPLSSFEQRFLSLTSSVKYILWKSLILIKYLVKSKHSKYITSFLC